jgi:Carboxypeptidase regulatory-like domain/TonB dependent receptor
MRRFRFGLFTSSVLGVFLISLCAAGVFAQGTTSGTINGSVKDQNGAVVAGASITIKNEATGTERKVTSGEDGGFVVDQVPPGSYSIIVEGQGFKRTVAPKITVNVSQTTNVNINLELGNVSETVTVTSGVQEIINTTSPTLTSIINTKQVVDLPLGDRNPINLAGLQAGIAVVGTDNRGSSISGLRQTAVNLTQDGINAMDNFVKTSSLFAITTPSLNSTSEFSITTGTVGADAGRGAAQVNIVTKGGTNEFHGGAFLQILNSWTDASPFFNNFNSQSKPIRRQHYAGFDIGGPAYLPRFGEGGRSVYSGKDKAFFFFSYERFVDTTSVNRNRVVLSQNARNGIFQYTASGATQTVNLLTLASVPFHTLNPLMTAHLALIPLPNNNNCSSSDGFNISCFQFNVSQLTTNDKYVARYDHQLFRNTKLGSHKLEFVFSRVITRTFPDVTTNGLEAPFPGGVNGFQGSTRNLVTPALVSEFGPHVTNVFRIGRQWAPVDFNRETPLTQPIFSLSGVLTNYDNNFFPQPRNTILDQANDTLSWVKGNHLFKSGMDWQNVLGISRNDAGIVETIQFGTNAANGAGIALANLPGGSNQLVTNATTVYTQIVGLLGSATQTLNVTSPDSGFVPGATRLRTVDEKDLALFAQDQWRMKSNLTLTYGIRWDYMGVPTVPNGLAIQPKYADIYGISGFGNLFKPTAAPGSQTQAFATQQFVSGKTGIGLYKNDWNNFAPSVGVAYSPSFEHGLLHRLFGEPGSSSIRGGYSVSYLHDGVTTFTNLLGTGTTNPGLIQTATSSTVNGTPSSPNLLGQLGAAGVPLIFPTFKMPVTDRDNFLLNPANGLWTADPNLRSPYVHQWSIGFEREIMKDTAFEIRYVGNMSPNAWRAYDINEVNIFESGFLTEFLNAQKNLALRGGTNFAPGCAGCVATPLLDKFFAGLASTSGSGYGSTTFISNLNNNNVGTMASTLAFNTAYRTNRENPALGIPANLFVANPNATFARVLANDAKSNYNAMEVEIRRRFSKGLLFQANYTWSKAMGDAVDAQGNNQNDLVSHLTLRDKKLDYRRSIQDQTQRFVANSIYELPFGKGKPFLTGANGVLDRVVGGWSIGGILTWTTGVPFYIAAGRATFNNGTANNGAQLVGISYQDFKNNVGIFKTPAGVFFINPNLLDITTNAAGHVATSKLKAGLMTAPAPGTFGNFPVNSLSGPKYFNLDMSLIKRIPITETVRFELKVTAINILNHPNFIFPATATGGTTNAINFDSTTFGLITFQRGNSRQMNFIGQIRF